MKSLVYILYVWVLALSILVPIQFLQIDASRAQARKDGQELWRAVACSIEKTELKNPKITPKQRTEAIKFWTTLLVEQVQTAPCA